jgi:hypothetical protein
LCVSVFLEAIVHILPNHLCDETGVHREFLVICGLLRLDGCLLCGRQLFLGDVAQVTHAPQDVFLA